MTRLLRCIITAAAPVFAACDGALDPPDRSMTGNVPAAPSLAGITLPTAAGPPCRPFAPDDRRCTAFIFLMRDCPVGNATAPELRRLADEFTSRGVRFFLVYTTETAGEAAEHQRAHELALPALLDSTGALARLAGATRVPEAAVFSPAAQLVYLGRIDDRAATPGTTRPVPRHHDLRRALEQFLAGGTPDPKFTPAIGCYLPEFPRG